MRLHFESKVKETHAALLIERILPRAVPPLLMTGLFASASWASVWDYVPHEARPFVLAAWAAATIASPLLIKGKSVFVRERDALRFIDDTQGKGATPATALKSTPPKDNTPEGTIAWNRQQQKLLEKWAPVIQGHKPAPVFSRHWLRGLAAASVAAMGTAFWAGEERVPRLLEAFNFTAPPTAPVPLDIKAWIAPPKGIKGFAKQTLAEGVNPDTVHKKSRLHIMVVGKQPKITLNGREIPLGETLAPGEQGQITYQYAPVELDEGMQEIAVEGGPRWQVAVNPDNPPSVVIKGAGLDPETGETLKLSCSKHDDYGIKGGRIILEIPGVTPPQPAPDVLPSAKLPSIALSGASFCPDAPAPQP